MIRFKSQATADLLMFNEHGIKVLELWGKAVTPQGILLRSDMPAALTAIEAFLAQASASANQANGAPLADDEADLRFVVHLGAVRRQQNRVARPDDARRRLEEEHRFGGHIVAHFTGVGDVVAANADDL